MSEMQTTEPASDASSMQPSPSAEGGPGLLFQLAAAATVSFIVTVLALLATVFADPAAPVNIWLNEHATQLLGGEVLMILVFGIGAMARDQWLHARRDSAIRER